MRGSLGLRSWDGVILPVLCLVPLLALPARACPMELGAGVTVRYDDGSVAHFVATDTPGLIRERVIMPPPDEDFTTEAWFGLYLEREWHAGGDDTGPDVSAYPVPPDAPVPGRSSQGLIAVVTQGDYRFERRFDLTAGPETEITIGDCSYTGFEADLRVFEPDYMWRDRFLILPALGIAIIVETEDDSGPLQFQPLSIEVSSGGQADQPGDPAKSRGD